MSNRLAYLLFSCFLLTMFTACSPNNTTVDNSFKKYFDDNKVDGCFGLWDNGQNQFTLYNLSRFRDSAYLPASTFKVVNSLIALHTGRIFSDTVVIPWDGRKRSIEAWNKDMNMKEAFAVSNVPYYQEVARRIGKDTMQVWLDSLKYGTRKITSAIDTFWLDNSLKITADEQLGLMKRLYFKQLMFNARSQEIVNGMMLRESNANYKLSYKTGWGTIENGNQLGWVVGWIEENKHVYFFAMNVESKDPNPDMVAIRMNILKGILKQLGFFEGKK
ncbi:MAG: class D beta-lactamase [Chitinophagaceae bacterium]